MWRGVDRWDASLRVRPEGVRYIKMLVLTCESKDWEDFEGAASRFTHAMRDRWPKARYFWQLELQARGAPHVNVFWVNAPQRRELDLNAWAARAWGAGFTYSRLITRARWLSEGAGYLKSYAKKSGPKAHQQDYTEVPPGVHIFGSSLKGVPNDVLDEHVSRWEARYVGGRVELTALLRHIPARTCAPTPGQWDRHARRRRYRAGRRMGRKWSNAAAEPIGRTSGRLPGPDRTYIRKEALARLEASAQLELLSSYAEWSVAVTCLPW